MSARMLRQNVVVTRIIEGSIAGLLALLGMTILLVTDNPATSLFGLGFLVLVALLQLRTIARQQREQTELLALIAEGQITT